ncbi:MAG: phosphopantetheine-binding protein [Hungatella sp.]|jgi:acyl carrier protein|nr:phosphopantetheine-binding protein [Hungatella sp.]MDR2024092.1 phosphopantetheine-binding protein [Hungatella sp.]
MNVKDKVRNYLDRYVGQGTIEDDDNIFEKRLVNSLFALQLVTFIEKEFGVSLGNEELDIENFKDINSITALVERKL